MFLLKQRAQCIVWLNLEFGLMGVSYTADQGACSRSCILTLPAAATTWRVALEATLVEAPKAQTVRMVVVEAISEKCVCRASKPCSKVKM
jgi:hypothetical protein